MEAEILAFCRALVGIKEKIGLTKTTEQTWRSFWWQDKLVLAMEQKTPLRLELRCERNLQKKLQEEYESVMQSRVLGKNGVEIILSGQLNEAEIKDLVRHAYEMTKLMVEKERLP